MKNLILFLLLAGGTAHAQFMSNIAAIPSSTSATVTWSTCAPANSVVEYGLSSTYISSAGSTALATAHSVSLPNLTPSTTYHYQVCSRDSAGESLCSADRTFTTAASSPTLTTLLGDQNIEAVADANASGQAQAFPVVALASGSLSQFSVYLDSHTGATSAYVGLYADANGTPGALLTQAAFTPKASTWVTVTVPAATITEGVNYWVALLGTGSGKLYFRDDNGSCPSPGSQSGLKSLPTTWTSAAWWTQCKLSVYGAGLAAAPPPPPPPPTVQHTASLSWTASTSSVVGYNIYRNGTLLNAALVTALSYVDSTVVSGSTYSYDVTAVDGKGVESLASNSVTVIIPSP